MSPESSLDTKDWPSHRTDVLKAIKSAANRIEEHMVRGKPSFIMILLRHKKTGKYKEAWLSLEGTPAKFTAMTEEELKDYERIV